MIVLLKHASYSKIAFIRGVLSPPIFISVTISFQHGYEHKDQCLLVGEEMVTTKADVLG